MARVLIVDDERGMRITLREFLVEDGHDVRTAPDADEALTIINENEIDVVVTDIILPKVTGVRLLQEIRKLAPDIQVILVTGEPTVETASEALRSGAFDYLAKPVSMDAIRKAVLAAAKSKEDQRKLVLGVGSEDESRLEKLFYQRHQALQTCLDRYRSFFSKVGR